MANNKINAASWDLVKSLFIFISTVYFAEDNLQAFCPVHVCSHEPRSRKVRFPQVCHVEICSPEIRFPEIRHVEVYFA